MRAFLASLLVWTLTVGCDVPIPMGTTTAATLTMPDFGPGTETYTGTLTESDGARPGTGSQAKADLVATVGVAPGETVHVLMESTVFDTYVMLMDGQTELARNDDWQGSRSRSFTAHTNTGATAQDVEVWAAGYTASSLGAYTVRVLVSEPARPPSDAIPITGPGTLSGSITAATAEYPLLLSGTPRRAVAYAAPLQAGQTVTARMESTDFDTYLLVQRGDEAVARNDDYQASRSVSQVTFTASASGVYTLFAGQFSATASPGNFTLTVTIAGGVQEEDIIGELDGLSDTPPTPTGPPPRPDAAQSGSFDGALTDDDGEVALTSSGDLRKADAYTFDLAAGQALDLEMESTTFDTYLRVFRSGLSVAYNDDAGSTRRSALRYTAPSAGTYTVYAGTFTLSGRGTYSLRYTIE